MTGIYFSGTGNSRYAAETFCKELNTKNVCSIEDKNATDLIRKSKTIIFAYPVQYSAVPKIVQDYITDNKELWKNKYVFVIATMALFSGDGAGCLGRLLKKYGARIIGGLHLKMPDSICDEKVLKRSMEKNREIIKQAEIKIKKSARRFKDHNPTKDGLGTLDMLAGLFGQRLYFGNNAKKNSDRLSINADKCIGCGKCEKLCPMKNIKLLEGKAVPSDKCTQCYRCVNTCPKQAITLFGKEVIEQGTIEKYL
ncbi:MAG: 4Fe-4S binding protein [Ruminococcus sp.]|nr:4Fe-4S binding protein [Ruminococcus sp.]